jgi:hypothetical protein
MKGNRRIMKVNRRKLLTSGLAGGAAAASLPLASFGQPDANNPNFTKLDAVLNLPLSKKSSLRIPSS